MEWLAVVGLVIMTTSFVPQILRIYRLKSARDLSRWTFYQLLVVNLLFVAYYITLGHWMALILNMLLGVAIAWILILTFIYR